MLIFAEMCVNLHPNLNSSRLMRQFKTIFMLLTALWIATSCLKSNDSEATYYSDAAITSFSIGNVYRYVDGEKSTVTGSNYTFHIDQVKHEIYNTDSLPIGTDVSRVAIALSTRNNSYALIQDLEDPDILIFYDSSDSIDFTKPRTFLIASSDGKGETEYTIRVNVHQEEPDKFTWSPASAADWPADAVIPEGIPTEGLHILGQNTWGNEVYALSEEGNLMVWRMGTSTQWEVDELDEDIKMLPTQDLALVSFPIDDVAEFTDYVILVGNRSLDDYPEESIAMVWGKIVDLNPLAPKSRWFYMGHLSDTGYALPRMKDITLARFDDCIVALGGAGIGGSAAKAYEYMYESRDDGITWKRSKRFTLPEGTKELETETPKFVLKGYDDNLWLRGETTGEVWRGRLSKYNWQYQE